jgi:hypothetical protein
MSVTRRTFIFGIRERDDGSVMASVEPWPDWEYTTPGHSTAAEGTPQGQETVRRESRRFPVGANPIRRRIAPAGSNRSGGGVNESVEAFGVTDRLGRFSEQAGRNMSER